MNIMLISVELNIILIIMLIKQIFSGLHINFNTIFLNISIKNKKDQFFYQEQRLL